MMLSDKMIQQLEEKAARFEQEPEPRRTPGFDLPEMKPLPWQETISFLLVDIWDAFKRAKRIIDAREPTYKRVAMRALKITEALIYIAGFFCSRKFKLFENITRLLKKNP